MSPELLFWLGLAMKLALTAGIVVTASIVTERAGPLIGALVLTLPVSIWPAYVFLALDHDAAFLAQSAIASLATNAVTAFFQLLYAVLAQRRGLLVSLLVPLAIWIILAAAAQSLSWTALTAVLANVAVYPACFWLASRYAAVRMPPTVRRWYDVPFRTLVVCMLMGAVILVGRYAGPLVTGILAVFPISTSSTMIILHPRIGGPACAAVIANGLWGMAGIGMGLAVLAVSVGPLGTVPALALALAVPVTWNLAVALVRTRARRG
jgi:hypothetical protein